jgi:hypothetical protein
VFSLLVIASVIEPTSDDQWFTNLFLGSFALFLLAPGVYIGWKYWFHGNQVKQNIKDGLPKMKNSAGFFYGLYTLFLPDNLVPPYFLLSGRLISLIITIIGITIILLLMMGL